MLKSDIIWPESRRFKTKSEWEPVGFFSECLCNATSFDLLLGFFSSSAISVLADGFATFLNNGGRMRLIINDILTETDKDMIMVGKSDKDIPAFDLTDIESLRNTLSERGKHFFECLSWLIRNERIEIKIIAPISGNGIAHTKCGCFYDGSGKVAFDGSVNFSKSALIDNKECLTAFCSWDGSTSQAVISDIEAEFKTTFEGEDKAVRYLDADAIRTRISETFGNKELTELLTDEYNLIEKADEEDVPVSVKHALKNAKAKVDAAITRLTRKKEADAVAMGVPCFPYPSGPRDYQKTAFENWKANKQKGLFAMATGTGKTITSLNCLLEIYKHSGYYKALILVPTIALVEQWEKECRKFNFTTVIKVCAGNPKWKDQVEHVKLNEMLDTNNGPKASYIIICTYASYSKEKVFAELNSFAKTRLLLIADEAHNMGSNSILKKIEAIPYARRIGLSATPERQFDDEGNEKLQEFFGASEKNTYEYSMEEAIEKGVLCRYLYYPHVVRLTDEEMEKYAEISKKLAKVFNFSKKSFEKNDYTTSLLIQRKAILHKAIGKLEVFRQIIEHRLEENNGSLKYTLVYAPEGNVADEFDSDLFSAQDYLKDDEETIHLIEEYTNIIRKAGPRITVKQFTSQSGDREDALKQFAEGKLDVLTSMKCLDEGVDVPRSELAIFCASTGNPRQFIQRRGRILRTHPDKHRAIIHDLVVVPEIDSTEDSYKMEKSLIAGELRRVRNFAILSENSNDSVNELDNILNHYNLSLFESDGTVC
ncbi:MAG: DEAD/DEAH box helicase family protein [Bacteroidales bacterium]|nr:DEAD/DEAH box helicase family protein [Candidatus Cacconaster equi]